MIFKPRIFISSTFSENLILRDQIKEFLYSVGAEPLLYERNLTPSTIPLVYRENMLDADFIILIIKEKYGTPTAEGLSGTHEEYKIACQKKIPTHVYLKSEITANSNPLIEDIKSNNVSYYYFANDADLFSRLKETIFIIAREIMLVQIEKNSLPFSTLIRLTSNYDYKQALIIIKLVEEMHQLKNQLDGYYCGNTLFQLCLSYIITFSKKIYARL